MTRAAQDPCNPADRTPRHTESQLPGPPVEPTPRDGQLPVSFGQQRLWFIAQMAPESPIYNEPIMVQMNGPVDLVALARSLTEITRRHEAWRTVFTRVNGLPVQEILPAHPFHLPVVDLTGLPPEQRELEALHLAVKDARRPFKLQEGPLVRALLLRLSPTEARLIVTAHHIVVDGVSFFSIFLPELHSLYAAFSNGQAPPLPELPFQYVDFAVWQRRWLTEQELAPKLSYWRAHMAGVAEPSIPTDYPHPSQPSDLGARLPVAFSTKLTSELRALGRRAGTTLFTTLLAAWKTLLFRYTGQSDIVVGSSAAGRPRPEFERLIGFFNHNLVLRTQVDGSLTFLELLARVHGIVKAAREHQDVPFDRLVTELKVERSPHKNPLYNNVFLLMPPLASPSEPPQWSSSRIDIGTAKVDLYLELHQRPTGLVGHVEYKTELFSAATIERMRGHLEMLLEGIVREPEQRVSELPLLTTEEQAQLSVWQAATRAPLPDREVMGLEQLFEAQAARSPEAIAVAHGEKQITYQELNARANRLAHYLRSLGVGPNTLVGLCIERSFDAMVGILGVLKAGGAYVPLDPDYPGERLRFILEDADIELLITSSRTAAKLPPHRGREVLLDDQRPTIAQRSADNPVPLATAADLAYVIYTSGSSGRPKGVLVERRGLYYLAKAQEKIFGIGVGSRVLRLFSLNFDGSVWDFTLTWPVGATLVLGDPPALLAGSNLAQFLKDHDIHAVMVTPSALAVVPCQELPALRILICGGEELPAELVNRWAPGRRFFNIYGPTEATAVCVASECFPGKGKPKLGRPFEHVELYILDGAMHPVPIGVPGELYIGGPGVARGYLARPDLTDHCFIKKPFSEGARTRLYKTGDIVKWLPDGNIDYVGRTDHQIKLRGFRIELGEIEAELGRHPAVQMAAVKVWQIAGDQRLVAYLVPRAHAHEGLESALKKHLRERLPEFMVPAAFVMLDRMPVTPSGKLERSRLPAPPLPAQSAAPASSSVAHAIASVWRGVLGVDEIPFDAPFFEIGGHSLALARVQGKLSEKLDVDIDLMTLMRLPTIRQLAAHITTLGEFVRVPVSSGPETPQARSLERPHALAIVGMAIRAPGVRNPAQLWQVILEGRETISTLDPDALIAGGASPDRVRRSAFVPVEGVLDDADRFDAAFFGYNDADAGLMDPQQRLFLECAYEALEHAGCDPARFQGKIGVFGGVGTPRYWLGPIRDRLRRTGSEHEAYRAQTLNAPDFLTTRVAFKLGLRGPALTVQTACSTSLSAVHLARQSLLAGECDMALAGGVSLTSLNDAERGHLHGEGGIESADGHCRPFDKDASGMVKSSGAVIVVLKRIDDALANGDTIYGVMLGSAMNNDGAEKIGFTAPSEDGVAEVILRAYETAGVSPESVQFVEAHGTGTRLGDPTEVRALTRAFRRWTEQRGFCALGSLKANLGHTDTAAGGAGLLKAVLSLTHGVIPKLVNFRVPNPLLDLPSTPFFIPHTPLPWPHTGTPRRAGVSAMGIGGTNVHVVLEEAPAQVTSTSRRSHHLLCLSARTEAALEKIAKRLGAHLENNPSLNIADVAHTLAVGRAPHKHRLTIVCRDAPEARSSLLRESTVARATAIPRGSRPVVFLFPGHGGQYLHMGLEVYKAEPVFRDEIDHCFEIVRAETGKDLRPLLLDEARESEHRLDMMHDVQPLLFTIEYALAKQFLAWGVRPAAMLGHSLGEYVAACIAGVFSLRDALVLVAARGRLMDTTPPGSMLTVFTDARTIEPYLSGDVAIATYAPGCTVLSGPVESVGLVRARLTSAGIGTRDVRVSRASHSSLMHAIRDEFRRCVADVELRPPALPVVSNVTGTYLTAEQAMNPDYWADHLCTAVQLTDGLGTLLALESPVCIELGPGSPLGSFLVGHPRYDSGEVDIVETLPSFRKHDESSWAALLRGVGRAWELGTEIDWRSFYAHERRRRIPLPTYPFEGRRYMLEFAPAEVSAVPDTRVIAFTEAQRERVIETSGHAVNKAPLPMPVSANMQSRDSAFQESEQLVQSIWMRLLGASHVPSGTSFFDLGGDSLLAAHFLAEVRLQTGCEIKTGQFMRQPTAEGIATLLHTHAEPARTVTSAARDGTATTSIDSVRVEVARPAKRASGCLVPLRSGGAKRPFFCVHPIGGGVLGYASLASAMDPERPFFGIQSPMLEDHSARPRNIEDMAALYLDAIRQVQPKGPYLVGGWSFGGMVAAEMARQLKRSGQAVAQLVLLDVSASQSEWMALLRRVDQRLPPLAMLPAIFAAPSRGTARNKRARNGDVLHIADNLEMAAKNLVVYDHHLALWRQHVPKDPEVPAIHFRAKDRSFFGSLFRAGGTRTLAIAGASQVSVPGDHFSMLSGDHTRDLAARIDDALDTAEQRERNHDTARGEGSQQRDEASVRAFLDDYINWARERDGASLGAIIAPDCVTVSTGESILEGSEIMREHYVRKMANLRSMDIRVHHWRVLVFAGGRAACATGVLDSDQTYGSSRTVRYRDARVSMVLERQNEVWRVVHMHFSVPVGGPVDTVG